MKQLFSYTPNLHQHEDFTLDDCLFQLQEEGWNILQVNERNIFVDNNGMLDVITKYIIFAENTES